MAAQVQNSACLGLGLGVYGLSRVQGLREFRDFGFRGLGFRVGA